MNRSNATPEIGRSNYFRPVMDRNIYMASRFFEADATTRYVKWWKKSVLGQQDPFKNVVQRKRSSMSQKKMDADADVPIGLSPKCGSGLSVRNDETDDQNGVLSSPVAAHKADGLMAMKVEMLARIENMNVVRGPKRAVRDARRDNGTICFASTADNGRVRKRDLGMKSFTTVECETSVLGLEEAN
ncbi:hypothetical protein K1719_035674 [Acacia pycnantha]|nr:hypothetical protein K1719_035674 [Acacia pycnantha]